MFHHGVHFAAAFARDGGVARDLARRLGPVLMAAADVIALNVVAEFA